MQEKCVKQVYDHVMSGEIPMEIIDLAVSRILKYKEKYNCGESAPAPQEFYKEHLELAQTISKDSITLYKGKLSDLSDSKILAISTIPYRASKAIEGTAKAKVFAQRVSEEFGADAIAFRLKPSMEDLIEVATTADKYDTVIYATCDAQYHKEQIVLAKLLQGSNVKFIHVLLSSPYDILEMEDAGVTDMGAQLIAYEYTDSAVESVIKALKGEYIPQGKLPVKLR